MAPARASKTSRSICIRPVLKLSVSLIRTLLWGDAALRLQQIHTIDFDYVVVCSRNYRDEMIQSLLAANVAENKIIAASNCAKLDNAYENNALMKRILKPTAVTGNLIWGHLLPFRSYDNSDYVRKATLSLVTEMMRKQNVEGALAVLSADGARRRYHGA